MNDAFQKTQRGDGSVLPVWKKMVFAIIASVVVLGIAEVVLGWLLPTPAIIESDPFVGFSPGEPLLQAASSELESGPAQTGTIEFAPSKLTWFNKQSFPSVKASNTYRIVCLGGSTTYGRPFSDATSYCGWLREYLTTVAPERKWEVINAGGISYASYRIVNVMREWRPYEVDLFVVYTGQNEFLESRTYGGLVDASETTLRLQTLAGRTHLGRAVRSLVDLVLQRGQDNQTRAGKPTLDGEVNEILNRTIGPTDYQRDPEWHRGVEAHFRVNLERMRLLAREFGSKLAIITPVSNLRDCSPFKGGFDETLSDEVRAALTEQLTDAGKRSSVGELDSAMAMIGKIERVDASNADVSYLLGKLLIRQRRFDEAADAFQAAIDLDVCPLRATSSIKAKVREFANQKDVMLVDYESDLIGRTRLREGHRCIGAEAMMDHVHPTIEEHQQIARLVLQLLSDQNVVGDLPDTNQDRQVAARIQSRLDRRTRGEAFRNLAKLTHWAGKFDEAARHARNAIGVLPDDLESHYVLADSLEQTGQIDDAMDQYTRLFDIGEYPRAYRPFGELLASEGHFDAAKAYLLQAAFAAEGDNQAAAFRALGRLHQSLGEPDLAQECFVQASQVQRSSGSEAGNFDKSRN